MLKLLFLYLCAVVCRRGRRGRVLVSPGGQGAQLDAANALGELQRADRLAHVSGQRRHLDRWERDRLQIKHSCSPESFTCSHGSFSQVINVFTTSRGLEVSCWSHLNHHEGLAVPTQRVLQQVGEAGVSERDVGVFTPQRVDDVSERRQRFVDALSLSETTALRPRLTDPLRARQVHQVQLS